MPNPTVMRLAFIAAALSLASLGLLPGHPFYDPYAWLVWGREIGHLDLATGTGPSWKPLTALLCVPLAPLGEGVAPLAWLLAARAGAIAMVLLAGRLAWRLAGAQAGGAGPWPRRLAAIAAGVFALVVADSFTPLVRQFAGGLAEPLAAALVLFAADRILDRRELQASGALLAAGLIRPEVLVLLAGLAGLAGAAQRLA